jgi:cobalamin synthase
LLIATCTALAIAVATDRWRGPAACMAVAAASFLWAWRSRRRIGGVTGDTLGAGIMASECLVLLLFTAAK